MRSWSRNPFLVSLALFTVVFFGVEIGLRIGNFDKFTEGFRLANGKSIPILGKYVQLDDKLGWVPTSDHRRFISNQGSERVSEENPIVALGGSFTFGMEVSTLESWPAQLQQVTGRRVINGGTNAYGVDQSILMSKALIERFKPDTVILGILQETVERTGMSICYGLAKPYFSLDHNKLVFHALAPGEAGNTLEESREEFYKEFRGSFSSFSILAFQFMKRFFPTTLYPSHKFTSSNSNEVACRLITDFRDTLKKKHIGLQVLIQEVFTWKADAQPMDELASCLRQYHVATIDTRAVLGELRKTNPLAYRSQFITEHMSSKGNRMVAEMISAALSRKPPDAL